MTTIGIIAALDRELAPLVRNWPRCFFSDDGRTFRGYQRENLVAVAAGIGRNAARLAARALVAQYHPQLLISAGVAGALTQDLKVGTVILPKVIIDSATSAEYHADAGSGILVTTAEIAGAASKQALSEKFHAWAVDMEAAAVAEVAQQERIGFRCIKAISDEAGFVMPPLNRFVDREGRLQTAKLAFWAAIHPALWPAIAALARNTNLAAEALCERLQQMAMSSFAPLAGKCPARVPNS